MHDVKPLDAQTREFLNTPIDCSKPRSQGSRKRSSDGLLLWMNVWLCLITVILLFQTMYPIIMAYRAERVVEEYLEQLGNVRSSVDKAVDKAVGMDEKWGAVSDERMKMLNEAFQDYTPLE